MGYLKSIPRASFPLIVLTSDNETDAQFLERWNKIDALPASKKDILSSELTIDKIEEIAKRFRLTYEETCDVSRLVRSIVFGEITISQIDLYLKQKIQHIGQADRENIKNIISEILSQRPSEILDEVKEKKITVNLQLAQALLKYPKVGEQNVTSGQIKLKYLPTPVRPSVKNWITDFHDSMGSGKHSTVDRGNFLFHSENGKRLTPTERQKLALLLKSLDDQTLLTIDTDAQVIVFGNVEEAETKTETRNIVAPRDLGPRLRENDNNRSFGNVIAENQGSVTSFGQVQTQKFPIATAQNSTREDQVENFFQIPESKPPIGSDSYDAEQLEKLDKKIAESVSEMNAGHLKSSQEKNKQETEAERDGGLLKKLKEKSLGFMKENVWQDEKEQAKQESQNLQKNFSPNFASNDGRISFSSAQKLPVEQGKVAPSSPQIPVQQFQPQQAPLKQAQQIQATPTGPIPAQPAQVQQTSQIPQPQKSSQPPMSPYRITPSTYAQQKNDTLPESQKNTVDLRS